MLLIVAEYGGKICTSEESAASKIFDLNSTAEQLPYACKYTSHILFTHIQGNDPS